MNLYEEEPEDKTGQKQAAGVTGVQQQEVIIVLEGDRESVTTPVNHEDNTVDKTGSYQIVDPNDKATDVLQQTLTDELMNKSASETPVQAKPANTLGEEANAVKQAVSNEANAEVKTNAAGEVTARMPEIRTQDSQENKENNSNLSGNGNLSPLENDNDKAQVEGQKDTTYSQAADAARRAVRDKSEPAEEPKTEPILNEIAPPLSEGIKPEQFRATQQMTQAALSQPVKPENLFQEMIDRVEMMQSDTKSAMTIKLNPDFLGNVALEVAVDAAGLHVKISAEDSGVRGMINSQITSLIESLENKGIAVVGVEVAYTGISYDSSKDTHNSGYQQNRQQTAKREANPADGIVYYAALPDLMDYYLDTGVSSVEYRA
jgi:flagellar hook-length control protein FliK